MRSNLFWKVSALFLVILLAFTAITLKIHIDASRNYALEVTQRMNHDLAALRRQFPGGLPGGE